MAAPIPSAPVSSTNPRWSSVRLSGDFETSGIVLPPFLAIRDRHHEAQGDEPPHRGRHPDLEHVGRDLGTRRHLLDDTSQPRSSVALPQKLEGMGVDPAPDTASSVDPALPPRHPLATIPTPH